MAQQTGRAHRFSKLEASKAGKLGGLKVSQNKVHMKKIGKLGGLKNQENLRKAQELREQRNLQEFLKKEKNEL